MFRLMYEDFRYRVIAAFTTDKAKLNNCALRFMSALDKEIGITGFANSRSYKLRAMAVSSRIVYAILRPVWWMRGY